MALLGVLMLTACMPRDPDETLDRVRGGELRVGISHNPPFTSIAGDEPTGSEVDLVLRFAEQLGAEVAWHAAGEEALMDQLKEGQLDLVIGGLSEQSPWTDKAALSAPYGTSTGADGKERKMVMAAALGENAFLMELEAFLADHGEGK
ncbi:Membrane-bound lytic murein transglycosylase F [Arthrobacter saudimassiliensis]|uniref:Membrane-bound lytic murein transglycosylase F n=1 Tax=Arthrobacter saudimassiliensis TaxID=1461584 RepID=A0A078MUF9_9MICC|nr:Membrane-bound lytic murein transglycosylase F [Arthrobacter saudimassiliensis]